MATVSTPARQGNYKVSGVVRFLQEGFTRSQILRLRAVERRLRIRILKEKPQ